MAMSLLQAATAEDDSTDVQINELLARATERLKAKVDNAQLTEHGQTNFNLAKLEPGKLPQTYISDQNGIAKPDEALLLDKEQKKISHGVRKVEDPILLRQAALKQKKSTAGKDWYDLPRTDLTPELKRDLQLLKMRNVLDPHRHYKKENGKMQAPEYSQVGTIIEGPTEFFSGRIRNRDRRRTFVEEVMAGEQQTGRFKQKYNEMQVRKTSGKRAYYKALKAKRKGGVKKSGNT